MTKLSELGERKIIQYIKEIITEGYEIGDDCARLDLGDSFLLVSTDLISKKTHIPSVMTPWQIGWFIVAINLSDIAAKGGQPLGLVLSLGIPRDIKIEFIVDFFKGADECATSHKTMIIGGDTKENPSLTISGTIVGLVKKDEFMGRKGAQPGDVVAVTGELGKAAVGFYAIQSKLKNTTLAEGLLEPKPRLREGMLLAKEHVVHCCMDISDGLSSSLYQLQEMNHIGFEIYQQSLPISPSLNHLVDQYPSIDINASGLHFGGDYELLFTIPASDYARAVSCLKKIGCPLSKIGVVTRDPTIWLVDKDSRVILPNLGYEHFK